MKHLISILLLLMAFSGFAVQLDYISGNLQSVETGLTAANRYDYDAVKDSTIATLERHFDKAGAVHLVADGVTAIPISTNYSGKSTADLITFGNVARLALISHFAQDSCHVNGADVTTTVPGALSTSASYESARNYINAINTSLTTHQERAHSTRSKIVLKELLADFITHCAADTADGSNKIHFIPDIVFNGVAMDSTGGGVPAAVDDSLFSAANVYKRHHNGHVGAFATNGSKPHNGHNATDSITAADATDYTTFVALVNEERTKYNLHAPRTSAVYVSCIHKNADANIVTTAAVSTASGHIAADGAGFIGRGHNYYYVKKPDRLTVTFTGTSVSTGASFYTYGSLDGDDWYYIDSTSVVANGAKPAHYNTNLHPYMKFYLNKRTDGTYNIQFRGEK